MTNFSKNNKKKVGGMYTSKLPTSIESSVTISELYEQLPESVESVLLNNYPTTGIKTQLDKISKTSSIKEILNTIIT